MSGVGMAGLVLAAGRSTRMPGLSKLARDWSDTTVLGAVLRTASEAGLSPLVVTSSGPLPPVPEGLQFAVVPVAAREAGRADSLAAGLAALPPGPVVVLLGDEPAARAGDVAMLIDGWAALDADIARVRYSDRPGHPVLLGPAARAVARDLSGDESVWVALEAAGLRAAEIAVDGPAPIDVDSPADLSRARSRHS